MDRDEPELLGRGPARSTLGPQSGLHRRPVAATTKEFVIIDAGHQHIDDILSLLHRLASFPIPARRQPEHLWSGDAELLKSWADGGLPEALVKVAQNPQGEVLGLAFAQLRPEALSQLPAAHLEVLAVAEKAEGLGVGRALMDAVERASRALGAKAMTLNVFMSNEKARGFYRHLGYDEELLRCIKAL